MTRYLLLFDSYGRVFVERPLWREDGSVICTCCWPLPAQSFSGPSPLELATIFYCLRFETSRFVASYDSQGHGGGIRPRLHTSFLIDSRNCSAYNISERTVQKTPILCCCFQYYSVTAVVQLFLSRSLPNNWSTFHNMLYIIMLLFYYVSWAKCLQFLCNLYASVVYFSTACYWSQESYFRRFDLSQLLFSTVLHLLQHRRMVLLELWRILELSGFEFCWAMCL
jgi:hypothetical protein